MFDSVFIFDTKVLIYLPNNFLQIIGNPIGYTGTMTEAMISQSNRMPTAGKFYQLGMIQFDVPITNGNSAGPLFNLKDQFISITSESRATQK